MTAPNETEEKAVPPSNPPTDNHVHLSPATKHANFIANLLGTSKRAYENATTNPEIAAPMEKIGMNQRKLAALKILITEAFTAHSSQVVEYSEKAESYAAFQNLYAVAHHDFSTLRKIARVAFKKDSEKLEKILANEVKKTTIDSSLFQMETCYKNLSDNHELMDTLAGYGITAETVAGYIANHQAAFDAYRIFVVENSEAIDATRIRDEKIEALADFMSDFIALAKIALADKPDLLRQISG